MFVALKEVTETLNVNIYDDPGLIEVITRAKGKELNSLNDNQKLKYAKIGRARMIGMQLLMGVDRDRFKSAIEEFEHAYPMDKRNNYPKTLHDCYTLLKGWKKGITTNKTQTGSVYLSTQLEKTTTEPRLPQKANRTWAPHAHDADAPTIPLTNASQRDMTMVNCCTSKVE